MFVFFNRPPFFRRQIFANTLHMAILRVQMNFRWNPIHVHVQFIYLLVGKLIWMENLEAIISKRAIRKH